MKTKPVCSERARALFEEGRTGYSIACTLRDEGYSATETESALRSMDFSVSSEEQPWGTVLNVSRKQITDGLAMAMGNLLGGGDEVAWHKKPITART